MNALAPLSSSALPAVFQNMSNVPDMNAAAQANMAASFGVVGYRGKNWRVKYRGEENLVKDHRGVPDPVLEVVIVGVSPSISKQYYGKAYTEGDDGAPDCFSVNGQTPDPASPAKQCESCAVCPMNVWGSKITEGGKKAKACQDSRRIAVVPLADILNEDFGGPMLLRVPPMSLGNLAAYSKELARFGAQPFMVETQLSFDHDVAYPQITFKAAKWIDDADRADQVKQVLEDPQIERILQEATEAATHDEAGQQSALAGGAPSGAFTPPAQPQQPPPPAAAAPAPAPQPKPAPTAPATAAPAKKKSPFGGGAAAGTAQAQPQPQPAQQAQVQQPLQQAEAPAEAAQMQPAPSDMESAIDDLLNG